MYIQLYQITKTVIDKNYHHIHGKQLHKCIENYKESCNTLALFKSFSLYLRLLYLNWCEVYPPQKKLCTLLDQFARMLEYYRQILIDILCIKILIQGGNSRASLFYCHWISV